MENVAAQLSQKTRKLKSLSQTNNINTPVDMINELASSVAILGMYINV